MLEKIAHLKKNRRCNFDYKQKTTKNDLKECIVKRIQRSLYTDLVIICIGTDRSTGDSLGPLVGMYLMDSKLKDVHIYGTMEDPVHALNLESTIEEIKHNFKKPLLIAIDASLGKLESVGDIQFADGPIKPGAGVQKELPHVGDFHISGIVNVSGFMEYYVLQNTRLSVVMGMAKVISNSLIEAIKEVR